MSELIEVDGRTFVPITDNPPLEWSCAIGDHPSPTLTLKDDDLFLITDFLGNIAGSGCRVEGKHGSMGLFCRDTRYLSRLELQINGQSPVLLSSDAQKGHLLKVLCANPQLEELPAETISLEREMVLNGALFEEIKITNYSRQAASFTISISFDADFGDLFDIRGFPRERHGTLLRLLPEEAEKEELPGEPEPDRAVTLETNSRPTQLPTIDLAYLALDESLMESRIEFNCEPPDTIKGYTAIWHLSLETHATVTLGYRLQPLINRNPAFNAYAPLTLTQAKAAELLEEQTWYQLIARIRTDNENINRAIEQAERDIFHLRQRFGKTQVLAAGVPWFSTLFGRDSLIAASQCLILNPAIAKDTLYILAEYQGKVDDSWRDEEPGKILHEIRQGEMARCQEIPHTPYYGTVDATPLWLMLYGEYYAWTKDWEVLEQLWDNALAAMAWIDRSMKETGYLSYNRRSRRGLTNQGWKDSGDCIVNQRGELAEGAIALCEVQAYVYSAKIRMSLLARYKGLKELAELWQKEARSLKARFNRDFWLSDRDYCALALDGEGKPVDSITSNPGHCLYLGILERSKANSVAERLQSADMFSGWGIRTLSSLSPAYNPMGYHVGSVWPHDNSLIALGLRSLGLVEQALEVAQGLIDMTLEQPYQRPPELFCGYERLPKSSPVTYPVACSPQAWATGTIFQLLQMMLNLVPDAPHNCLRIIDPALPPSINRLSIENLRVGQTLISLEFDRSHDTTACRVTKKRGNLRVIVEG
jgi:glycogen debranching enzyme